MIGRQCLAKYQRYVCSLFILAVIVIVYILYGEGKGTAFEMPHKKEYMLKNWTIILKEMAKDIMKPEEYQCQRKISRGHPTKVDCNTYPFVINKKCLVYSLGINNDWRFDDVMARLNCEVHAFDPSMVGVAEHIRPSGVHFHPIGIAGFSATKFRPRMDIYTSKHRYHTWTMKTLSDIMDTLGHKKKHIDILKMDIEGYEWDVMQNIIQAGYATKIRQLLIELHIFVDTPKQTFSRLAQIYQSMKDAGFRKQSGSVVKGLYDPKRGHMQAELSYVNVKFDFKMFPVD